MKSMILQYKNHFSRILGLDADEKSGSPKVCVHETFGKRKQREIFGMGNFTGG